VLAQGGSLPLPRGRLYPPTASAPDSGAGLTRRPRDPLSHVCLPPVASFPPFAFRLASTHLGWGTRRQFTRRSRDPPGFETPTISYATLDICNPKEYDTCLPVLDDFGVAYTRETHSLMKCIKDTFIGEKNFLIPIKICSGSNCLCPKIPF
jgi:hypothetical protein